MEYGCRLELAFLVQLYFLLSSLVCSQAPQQQLLVGEQMETLTARVGHPDVQCDQSGREHPFLALFETCGELSGQAGRRRNQINYGRP